VLRPEEPEPLRLQDRASVPLHFFVFSIDFYLALYFYDLPLYGAPDRGYEHADAQTDQKP